MHIPDGFLATPVWATMDVAAAAAVAVSARRAQAGAPEGAVPLLGVLGAFIFAAQMVNFPVGAGTSSHLVGSALLATTVGPAPAIVVMTAILVVQALVFQDGGLLALGANVFNMGIAGVLAAWAPFRFWAGGPWRKAGIFLGGVLSVLAAASLTILDLRLSGVAMPAAVLGVAAGLFTISAVIEGAITLAVFQALERMNPGWIQRPAARQGWLMGALAAGAIALASAGALLASSLPDGLESIAEKVGISSRARALVDTPLADYSVTGLTSEWMSKVAAGLAGLVIIYLACLAVGRMMGSRSPRTGAESGR